MRAERVSDTDLGGALFIHVGRRAGRCIVHVACVHNICLGAMRACVRPPCERCATTQFFSCGVLVLFCARARARRARRAPGPARPGAALPLWRDESSTHSDALTHYTEHTRTQVTATHTVTYCPPFATNAPWPQSPNVTRDRLSQTCGKLASSPETVTPHLCQNRQDIYIYIDR